ncbi:MAG: ABC transporter ATP-binding protein [Anaerolineaceae bacterium]|nr:ABC transporter ATP-binding protein [Anaerolineaceae bacterium]
MAVNPNNFPILQIHNLEYEREDQFCLKIADLEINSGEVLAVIGPNGAGKTTLLMLISGMLAGSKGEIRFNGKTTEPWHDLNYRRQIAMVMQSPLLLHTSVFENVATGLRFRGTGSQKVQREVNDWLNKLGILHLKKRSGQKLSGGEAQRASLARALVLKPSILLMDEPFGALDNPTRVGLLDDIRELLETTRTTSIFVTHDLDEALFLGDRMAVLVNGELRQTGTPEQVFNAPVDPQVASFVGVETIIAGQVIEKKDGMITVEANGVRLQAVGETAPGRNVLLCLRPEDVTLFNPVEGGAFGSARNHISGRVAKISLQGSLLKLTIDGAVPIVALVTRSSVKELGLEIGAPVLSAFKASAVHVIEKG